MASLIALLVIVVTLISSTTSQQCPSPDSVVDDYRQYNITICPLIQALPVTLTNITRPTFTGVDDGINEFEIFLPFPIQVYGVDYDRIWIGTNGVLSFGSTGMSWSGVFPLSSSDVETLPAVAPMWTDLYLSTAAPASTIVYSTQGTAGNRQFIVRWENMRHFSARTSNDILVSFDVLFYENPARQGDIDFRYYRFDMAAQSTSVSESIAVTVGMSSLDDGSSFWSMFQPYYNNASDIGARLLGKQMSIVYVGEDLVNTTCGALGYNLTSLRNNTADLLYTDGDGNRYYFNPCGELTTPICADHPDTNKAMLCRVPVGPDPTPVDLGVWAPGSTRWDLPQFGEGVNMVLQNGGYCGDINAQIFTRVQFICAPDEVLPRFVAAAGAPGPCVFILTVISARACGGPVRSNSTNYPASTLPRCTFTNGAGYLGITCPRRHDELAPRLLTAPVQILQGENYANAYVPLNFPFQFYSQTFTSVNISTKGALYFGARPYLYTPYSFPLNGMYGEDMEAWPSIIPFGGDFQFEAVPGIPEPNVSYSYERNSLGQRQFIVRYWDCKYWNTRGLIDQVVSFDVVLTEGDFRGQSGIEFKYYKVSPSANQVTIGVHGPDSPNTYTSHSNDQPLSSSFAFQLQGTTMNYTYAGPLAYDACAAFGVNFTNAITGDLIWNNPDTNTRYYIRPCGYLTTPTPCRNGTSVCSVSGTRGTVLSTFNPSAVIWQPSPAPLLGVRSLLRDGAFCSESSASRVVQLDWICSRATAATYVAQVIQVSSCITNVQIYTPIACDATAVCSTVRSEDYRGTLCPTRAGAPKLVLTNQSAPILVGADDDALRVNIPFPVKIYGQSYGRVWISTNGVLSFGPRAITVATGTLPLTGTYLNSVPVLAAFWADLLNVDQSRITYSNEVINNTRVFVVRYSEMEYWQNSVAGAADSVSFDVVLFETGRIEVRYYGLNPSSAAATRTVTVGVMSNDEFSNLVLMNNRGVDASTAASLSNSTFTLQFTGIDESNYRCGNNTGYDFTSLQNRDFFFNNSAGSAFYISVCSPVRSANCLSTSEKTSFCQESYNSLGQPTTVNVVAEWEPANVYYHFPKTVSTGVQMIVQGGLTCGSRSQVAVYNLLCNAAATTPVLNVVYSPDPCTFVANISSSAMCGPGNRAQAQNNSGPFFSTLTSCQTITGRQYDATLCPRARNDPYVLPERMTNPTPILAADDAVLLLNISFPFFIYDVPETMVAISSNGLLTFGFETRTSGVPAAFPSMGLDSRWYPNIAAFWTNLINLDTTSGILPYEGFIHYSREGLPPNRRLIFRFQDVNYFQASLSERSASFDIILSEGQPGGIEIRYYQIEANVVQNVVIGMHGYRNDYTSVKNVLALNNQLAGELQGSTLRFTFTGRHVDDVCAGVAGGYNLSSLANRDLSIVTGGYTYYYRPCGTVTAPDCVAQYQTSRVSLCQATVRANPTDVQYTYALAGDAVASTTFSTVFGSSGEEILRATITDGQYCDVTRTPRMTIIDYICDRSATNAFISFLAENSTCVYYVRVNTAVACSAPLTCTNYPGRLYNGRLCIADSIMNNKVVQTSPVEILAGADDSAYDLSLPFSFHIYGQPINHVFIYVNGYLSWGPEQLWQYSGPLPYSEESIGQLPFLPFYLCDLKNQNSAGNSSIKYSIEGTYPNRFLLVRYQDINHYNWENDGEALLSFDIKLYEGGEGRMEILYYKQSSMGNRECTVGIQSNDGVSYTSVANYVSLPSSNVTLQGKFLRWYYTGEDYTNVPRCGGLGYNLLSLMDYELSYVSDDVSIYYQPCGIVQAPVCSTNAATRSSMACAIKANPPSPIPFVSNMAVYNPNAAVWSYIPNGVQQYMPTGSYCYETQSPGITYTNFVCNDAAIEPQITNYVSSAQGCINVITIQTQWACGPGNRPPPGPAPIVNSTLTSCYSVRGSNYDATVCPKNTTDPYFAPVSFTPNNILVGIDDGVENVRLPFPFSFYGRMFTEINISSNGLLQFGSDSTSAATPTRLGNMPVEDSNWPAIAAFWSNLWNAGSLGEPTYEGKIQWGVIGQTPNRQMIIRFYMLDYYQYRYFPSVTGVSFDVFLKEGENQDIEIRYYRVDPNVNTQVTIGLRADELSPAATTVVQDYELISSERARQIAGSVIRFRYTGQSASAACGAFGYSVRSISNADISVTHVNGHTYVHRPCGVVSNTVCLSAPVTEQSSLCEIQGTIPLYSATTFSPSSITWTRLTGAENGIESHQQTGTYCPSPLAAPRIAHIKYICSATATTPSMTILLDNPCVYNATVMTSAVCAPVPFSSTGAASSTASPSSSASPSSTAVPSSTGPVQPSTASTTSSARSSTVAPSSSVASVSSSSSPAVATSSPVSPTSSSSTPSIDSSSTAIADADSSSSSSLGGGAIAGIVIGCIVGVCLLALLLFCMCAGRAAKGSTRLDDKPEDSQVASSAHSEAPAAGVDGEGEELEMQEV